MNHLSKEDVHCHIVKIENIKNIEDLNEVAKEIQGAFQTLSLKTVTKYDNKKDRLVDKDTACDIQGLYDNKQHRAVQEILFGPIIFCKINAETIESRFTELLNKEVKSNITNLPPDVWKTEQPVDNKSLIKKFTNREVQYKLMAKINNGYHKTRTAGLDRLSYQNLIRSDKSCSILAALFNACLKFNAIPTIWKDTYSVLVKQSDDVDKIENWKLITMHNTTTKLFSTLITKRLILWAKENNRFSSTQKGHLLTDATCEASFILQECDKYAYKHLKNLCVAWLDFSNASETIPQNSVIEALERHLVPSSMINLIKCMIEKASTKIRIKSSKPFTKSISITRGLPHGSPINAMLIDLIIEPILRVLNADTKKFNIFNRKINHLAIPNELILIAEKPEDLQYLLEIVEINAKLIGLNFNLDKCSTYVYDGKANENLLLSFKFFNRKLNIVPEEQIQDFFGVQQGLSIGQDGVPTFKEMKVNVNKIYESKLNQFQKVESIQTFIIPRIENYLRSLIDTNFDSLKEIDSELKNIFKTLLSIPDDATDNSIVYHAASMLNDFTQMYLPFIDLFHIMKVVHAFKILTSEDPLIKHIALKSLKDEVTALLPKKKKKDITTKELVDYLNGNLHTKSSTVVCTIWQMTREATLKLKKQIKLQWQINNDEIVLTIGQNNEKNKVHGNIPRFKVTEELKSSLYKYYTKNMEKNNNAKAVKSKVINRRPQNGLKNKRKSQQTNVPVKMPPPLLSYNYPTLPPLY